MEAGLPHRGNINPIGTLAAGAVIPREKATKAYSLMMAAPAAKDAFGPLKPCSLSKDPDVMPSTERRAPSGALFSRLEPIPDPRFRHYVASFRGIRLYFLSQLSYKDAQVLRLFDRIAAPHRRKQGAMREDAARVADEVRYQIEFLGC